ncbi:MAG: hypothetical protein EOM02_13005 [Synergistales bacterium]|nr:hypothetical protein [Synergistales bacterium]
MSLNYLPFNPDGIPEELKALSQWCCWRLQPRGEGRKPGKVPVMAMSPERNASVSDPSTWTTFDRAMETYTDGKTDGLSLVLTAGDPYTIVDLDDVIQTDGSLSEMAADLVQMFGSYTEVSAGGSGLHIIVKGRLTGGGIHKKIEVYSDKKVMALTGVAWGEPRPIVDGQSAVSLLEKLCNPPQPKEAEARRNNLSVVTGGRAFPPRSDDEVWAAIERTSPKGKALLGGSLAMHGNDHSSADASLCVILAEYTNEDPYQMDRIFRRSGLMSPKWNRADYRRRTLAYGIKMHRQSPSKGRR